MNALSPRVAQVCEMRRQGMTSRAIAVELGMSPSTVSHYSWLGRATGPCLEEEREEESPREARARVAADLASGVRCGHRLGLGVCCLLKPCDDHEAT